MRQPIRVPNDEPPDDSQESRVLPHERSLEHARRRQRPNATPFADKDSWYHEAIVLERIRLPQQTSAELRIVRGSETKVLEALPHARFVGIRAIVTFFVCSIVGLAIVGLFLWAPLFIVASYFARTVQSAALIAAGVAIVGELVVLRILLLTTRRR